MSLGSDKLGKKKAVVGKGLASGVEFKSNPYEILDDFFHDPNEEIVVYIRNKYFRYSVLKFLQEMNFTFLESELEENDKMVISMVDGTFKFIDHMEDNITHEIPYDWDSLEADIRDYVKENPIVKKVSTPKDQANWDKPNGVDDEVDLIDKSMDSVKSHIKTLKDKFNISVDEVKKMVKDYQKKIYHGANETTYPAKGNPDVKLRSGIYNNMVDLIKTHEWESQFESDYGKDIFNYMRNNTGQGTEERLLSEFGFEYVLENITIDESEFWSNRVIEVKYKDQEELPEVDMSEFEEIIAREKIENGKDVFDMLDDGLDLNSTDPLTKDENIEIVESMIGHKLNDEDKKLVSSLSNNEFDDIIEEMVVGIDDIIPENGLVTDEEHEVYSEKVKEFYFKSFFQSIEKYKKINNE